MDERLLKVFKMDYIKEEGLVLEIAGAQHATIREENVLDEDVVRDVKRMVRYLFLAGALLALLAVVLELGGPRIPVVGEPGESTTLSGLPIFLAVAASFIGTFYLAFFIARKDVHTTIVADRAKGTIQVQQQFKSRERKPRVTVSLTDVTRLECKSEEVYNSDGPNYNETGIYARGKNDQLTKLTWFGGVLPLEKTMLHFNAWLHGKEVGPAVYREQI